MAQDRKAGGGLGAGAELGLGGGLAPHAAPGLGTGAGIGTQTQMHSPQKTAAGVKTNAGRFFEDYTLGEVIHHAVPRTVTQGERALYHMLYPARHALHSSDQFARACGLEASPLDDLIAFHVVFGKTVPDVSLNAVANLGYGEGRFLRPVRAGDTLRSQSQVIGLKQNSNGKTGVVWVRTQGLNQHDETVLEYVRWVMVRKDDPSLPAPETVIPTLAPTVSAQDLVIPEGLDFTNYDFTLAGEAHRWADYTVGEVIDHVDGVTIEEAEHMLATRLWQNTAKVHFDATHRADGKRLIYGGHVISMARALSFNGMANAQSIVAINAGAHANPCFAGDTIRAWSEILDKAETSAPGIGALRVRLVATKGAQSMAPTKGAQSMAPTKGAQSMATTREGSGSALKGADGKYLPDVLLDLDIWVLVPL